VVTGQKWPKIDLYRKKWLFRGLPPDWTVYTDANMLSHVAYLLSRYQTLAWTIHTDITMRFHMVGLVSRWKNKTRICFWLRVYLLSWLATRPTTIDMDWIGGISIGITWYRYQTVAQHNRSWFERSGDLVKGQKWPKIDLYRKKGLFRGLPLDCTICTDWIGGLSIGITWYRYQIVAQAQ
jgi:hypothetical protein